METEYMQDIDAHTRDIIVSQIDVLLNYSQRFYTRQFQTRDSRGPGLMQDGAGQPEHTVY